MAKVLEVNDLHISFKTDSGIVKAVRGVSFELNKGETLCIVGESGSGKSVTSKAIMGILANNSIVENGSIIYEGEDLLKVSEDEFHRIRGNKIGMIFQDPLSSLNPIMRIGKQITEAMLINSNRLKTLYHNIIAPELMAYKNCKVRHTLAVEAIKKEGLTPESKAKIKELNTEYVQKRKELKIALNKKKKEAKEEVRKYKSDLLAEKNKELESLNKLLQEHPEQKEEIELKIKDVKKQFTRKTRVTRAEAKEEALRIMREVGIPEPERRFRQYPFEFSGGMRQRIVIAIALTANPDILICDEPTTALDVTIQAQILELINKLKVERQLSCIFITHDLGVVANMADRVAVMYAGKIVEYGNVEEIFYEPKHPYTWALLSSIPDLDSKEKLEAIPGTPPDMIYPPAGDAFALRSKYAMEVDFKYEPPFFKVSDTHYAATWLLHKDAPHVEMPRIVQERIKKALKGGKRNG